MLRTFYVGPDGWSDRQYPDGRIVWTSPTGHTYITEPGGALFFPQFAASTGKLVLPNENRAPGPGRNLMMPTRTRTRTAERQYRINRERAMNHKRLYLDVDPPPF